MTTEKESRRDWPEIAALFLGLIMSGYAVWAESNPWLISLVGTLTAIALVMVARDSGILIWWRRKRLDIKADLIAKKEFPRLVKMIGRGLVYQDVVRELRDLDWKVSPIPQFSSMSFENWYNDILRGSARLKIQRSTEMELLGDRFHDLFSVMNTDYSARSPRHCAKGTQDIEQSKPIRT